MPKLLSKYLQDKAEPSVGSVISDIARACESISEMVALSGLMGLHGEVGSQNSAGDQVKVLDEKSNVVCKQILANNQHILALAIEEEESIVHTNNPEGELVVAFDPLDGSANIDINALVGTIFSVLPALNGDESDFLQTANKQVAAGYVLYGSSTVLVFSLGDEVVEFTLNPATSEFLMTRDNIVMPQDTGYIAYNPYVLPKMPQAKAVAYKALSDDTARSMRWLGAMVGDVHRTLMKGGFFAYPENKKGVGKLRMQYEAKPLDWLVEVAGGKALTANESVGKYQSKELHEKVAVELGDGGTMRQYLGYLSD